MADTLESLEIEVKHSATGAADEIKKVSSAIRSLKRAIDDTLPELVVFRDVLGKGINFQTVNNFNNITNSINKVTSASKKAATAAKGAANGVKEMGSAAQKAKSPLDGFVSSLKRIAFYRMIRSIIKAITEALQEGLENAYLYSQQVGGELAPAMDRLSSSTAKLKNQLGAAFGQLLQALEPILEVLIWLITKLAEAITWLIALLSGADTYLVANDISKPWKETEDATKGATKAVKEYKNQLLGFDEINKLIAPDDNDRGKTGDDNDDYSGLFHREKMNFKLPEFKSDFLAPLAGAFPPIIDAIGELVSEFELLEQVATQVATAVESAWERICLTVEMLSLQAITAAQNAWMTLTMSTQLAWEYIIIWVQEAWSTIVLTIGALCAQIVAYVQNAWSTVSALTVSWWSTVSSWTSVMWELICTTVTEWCEQTVLTIQTSLETIYSLVVEAWTNVFTTTAQAWEAVQISIATWLEHARTNIEIFTEETLPMWLEWAKSMVNIAWKAFESVAKAAYEGLKNTAHNVATFVNTTAQNIWDWGTGTLKNIAEWANGVSEAVGAALESAWNNFVSFMQATGQAVTTWWSRNRTWVIPAALTAVAIKVASIALAPFTGGASLAGLLIPAANGGVFDEGQMFIAREAGPEMVGTIGNHTAVANNEQIVEAVSRGVFEAVSAAMSGNNSGNGVTVLNINGREFARAIYGDWRTVEREHGNRLVVNG